MAEAVHAPKPLTFDVDVTQTVRVTLDSAKFTPEFMAEFRQSFYRFYTLNEHFEHLAQLAARGVADLSRYEPTEFVEGYGPIGEMGISAEITDTEILGTRLSAVPTPETEG